MYNEDRDLTPCLFYDIITMCMNFILIQDKEV